MRTTLIAITLALALTGCRRDRDDPQATTLPSATIAGTAAPSLPPGEPSSTLDPPTFTAAAIPVAQPGEATGSAILGGIERTWRLYVPSNLPAGARVPLLIGLHGGLGSGEQFARNTRFDAQAEEGVFIAVYPDGIGTTWNGGRCCGVAARTDVDDVGFIAALIDQLAVHYPIDQSRVYAVGHSNGGIMALRLGCELSDRLAAVGAVAGSLEVPGCAPARALSVLVIHGDADESHPLEGGQGPNSIAGVDFTSVSDTMETVRQGMSCAADLSSSEEGGVTTTNWTGCPPATKVELNVIAGASHAWPGGTGSALGGEASDLLDATQALWDFLSPHSR